MTLAGAISSLVRPVPLRTRSHIARDDHDISGVAVHNDAVDVFRLLAAAGIIYCHAVVSPAMDRWSHLFRFAVPFFLFASLYFQSLSLRRNPSRSLSQYIGGRFKRLYLPFLAWSLIYVLARDIKRLVLLHEPPMRLHPELLWNGPEYHLWFLPFLLLASILLAVLHRGLLQRDRRWRWPLIAIFTAIGVALAVAPMPAAWDATGENVSSYLQWWRALPATCFALAFAWLMTTGPNVYAVSPLLGVAGLMLAMACSVYQVFYGIQGLPRALSGLGCMLAALGPWRGHIVSSLARIGRYGYGIFLCHVLIVEIIHSLSDHAHLAPTPSLDLAAFVLSFLGSLALVFALSRSPRTAWLNG